MSIEEFYDEYTKWSLGAFGLDNPKHGATKLLNGAKELVENPTDIKEQADCLMCLMYNFKCAHPDKPISELINAAMAKLEVNKTREWIKQPDGTYQSVK